MTGPAMPLFTATTLLPVPLLAAAAVFGGWWAVLALAYLTVFTFALDQLVPLVTGNAAEGSEFPAADKLSTALAIAHFGLLPLGTWAVAGGGDLSGAERIACFLSFGLFFGQVSNSNAHELIHRARRPLFELGKWVYISLLFGHHTSAHRLVHHVHVATDDDPNTAWRGESFYDFAPRAWVGSFVAGLEAENARNSDRPLWRHPYVAYIGGGLACVVAVTLAFGGAGLLAYLALCAHAQAQLLLSDYVQHYGLYRHTQADGRAEPVGAQHSWNAPHWFSGYLMLHAPRHSDHHAHPARSYPALRLPEKETAPTLPYSLPAMATLALFPSRWRRVMDKRASRWSL